MKSILKFDFTVDKENNTIHVTRDFDAPLQLVWKAWTVPEILDQWWGPKPWRAETKSMDFREGGHWLYAMVGPEGEKHWSMSTFLSIEIEQKITSKGGFSDEHGVINTDLPRDVFESQFDAMDNKTRVNVTLSFESLEDLEQNLAMGFQEGFTMGLNQLDELLEKLQKNAQ